MNTMQLHSTKSRMGDQTMDFAMLAVLGVGAYLLYRAFSGIASGGAQGANNTGINTSSAASASADLAKATSKGIIQSLPDTTLNSYATSLFQLLGNSSQPMDDSDFANLYGMLSNIQNDADWFKLVSLFGTKQFNSGSWLSACALSGGLVGCDSYDLPAAMRQQLSQMQIDVIRNYFVFRNMTARL